MDWRHSESRHPKYSEWINTLENVDSIFWYQEVIFFNDYLKTAKLTIRNITYFCWHN